MRTRERKLLVQRFTLTKTLCAYLSFVFMGKEVDQGNIQGREKKEACCHFTSANIYRLFTGDKLECEEKEEEVT